LAPGYLIGFLENVFLDGSFADESVDVDVARLADSVATILKKTQKRTVATRSKFQHEKTHCCHA
jgi:hypothetical protein